MTTQSLSTATASRLLLALTLVSGPLFWSPRTAAAQDSSPSTQPSATQPASAGQDTHAAGDASVHEAPSLWGALPFVVILLCIAVLPLIPSVAHWWHKNSNKLLVSIILAGVTLAYYLLRGTGFHAEPGLPTALSILHHSVLREYLPFMILLFSLYTICGGIQVRGDLKATPLANCMFLGTGAVLASLVGTTGASMLLIRPLLQTNRERRSVKHTVVFFIFLVSNIGGSLLPTGDPPLFIGYLRGVPFLWTLILWKEWLFCTSILLAVYFVWDTFAYRKETPPDRLLDATRIEPLSLKGRLNFLWLLGVILSVALIIPGSQFLGRFFVVPYYLREAMVLVFIAMAWATSSPQIRKENEFDFGAITEVAVLFIGIFITMQVPIEILNIKGPTLGMTTPASFFWAAGGLSSFLDNAPTYVVFFETANSFTHEAGPGILRLASGHYIREDLLTGISLGAVFMGANTYIGNGPNFMVKSIAESSGVKMPSFFGYMLYSVGILIPLFVLVMFVFLMPH